MKLTVFGSLRPQHRQPQAHLSLFREEGSEKSSHPPYMNHSRENQSPWASVVALVCEVFWSCPASPHRLSWCLLL